MAQYIHLRTLREEGHSSQSELSALLGIEKASSTRVLDELARRDLILRGHAKIDQAMTSARSIADRASKNLNEEELFQLFLALDKMVENLSAEE
jgi:DNA-binding MarR family transcriptional regulator